MGACAPPSRGRTRLTLVCPYCRAPLTVQGKTVACPDRHSFDVARSGYVNLLPSDRRIARHEGDSRAMVQARQRFCDAGHYEPLVQELARHRVAGGALDVGGGTGYFLDRVCGHGVVNDLSRDAADLGARRYPALTHVVADTRRHLPFADGGADLILNVFSPRNPAEFHRLLRPAGLLLVVIPAADHIADLRAAHGLLGLQPDKKAAVLASLSAHFTLLDDRRLAYDLHLPGPALADLVAMGPSARHLDPIAITHLHDGEGAHTTFSFDLLALRPGVSSRKFVG